MIIVDNRRLYTHNFPTSFSSNLGGLGVAFSAVVDVGDAADFRDFDLGGIVARSYAKKTIVCQVCEIETTEHEIPQNLQKINARGKMCSLP